MSLIERVRGGSEAAPWVVDEIEKLCARVADLEREYVADVDRLTQETWAAFRSRDEARADLAGLAECRERVAAAEWMRLPGHKSRFDRWFAEVGGVRICVTDGLWYVSAGSCAQIGRGEGLDREAGKAAASECAAWLMRAMEAGCE